MLFIVSTPIGNLDDISLRQAKTLISSDIILAEDTRSAQILIDAIQKRFALTVKNNMKIISYYREKEFEKLPEVIEWLKQNKNISLISESGSPLVSDPGYLLVKTCVKEKIPLTVIPGPSAVISALTISGFDPSQFMFLGFFPKKQSEKNKLVHKLMSVKISFPEVVFVFYESAQRIDETLRSFPPQWNPEIAICREITKKFEEVARGKTSELVGKQYKGEITVLVK